MIKKLSLGQFEKKDFVGYQELMEREHSKENRLGMIKVFGGVNIFLMILSTLWYFLETGRFSLLFISVVYFVVTVVAVGILCLKKFKNSVIFQFVNIGIQFFFSSLFFLFIAKYMTFDSEKKSYYLSDSEDLWLEITLFCILIVFAILGYIFYVFQIRKGTYSKQSSYINYVRKNTTKDYKSKYRNFKPWLLGLILLGSSIPSAIFFLDEGDLTIIIGLFLACVINFITPLWFIVAYFCKKFPELTEDQKSKVKRKKK